MSADKKGWSKLADTHCDISKRRPHHEVEDPGLQLEDVGWREHHPSSGQDKEEDGRKEGQEGFIQAAVLQSVIAVSPAKPEEARGSALAEESQHVKESCTYFRTL